LRRACFRNAKEHGAQRGFHRIGLVVLVPLCVLSIPLFAYANFYIWMTAPPLADYYAVGPLP
jgi:hypothetical protein